MLRHVKAVFLIWISIKSTVMHPHQHHWHQLHQCQCQPHHQHLQNQSEDQEHSPPWHHPVANPNHKHQPNNNINNNYHQPETLLHQHRTAGNHLGLLNHQWHHRQEIQLVEMKMILDISHLLRIRILSRRQRAIIKFHYQKNQNHFLNQSASRLVFKLFVNDS